MCTPWWLKNFYMYTYSHSHHPEQGLESSQLSRKLPCTTSLSTAHPQSSPLFWPLSPYSSEKDIFILEDLLVNKYLKLYTNNSNFLNWHKLSERIQGQVSKKMILKHTYITAHQASLEFVQVYVPWVGDVIQPSHGCLSPPSPPAFNLSQHQGLFQWVISSHQVAEVLELQLQHWSFQWIFRKAWQAVVHGLAKSRTQRDNWTTCYSM